MNFDGRMLVTTLIILLLASALLASCGQVGELQTVTEEIPLDGAERAQVVLEMGAGRLDVSGGAAGLMAGEFTFNVEEWEPTLDYTEAGESAELVVSQPELETMGTPDGAENTWDVQLTERVPLALEIHLGAGEADLALAALNLRELTLQSGASNVMLDLAREWNEDLDAEIRGGVGELAVQLPATVGVAVNVDQGLGDLNVAGLTSEGNLLVNEAYGQTEATLNLDIESGIGSITLEVVE